VTEKKPAGCSMIWLEQVQIVCTKWHEITSKNNQQRLEAVSNDTENH
jgi:hypothetical protein